MCEDNWCLEEEKQYVFGDVEIFMPQSLIHLHQQILREINTLLSTRKGSTEYHTGVLDVRKIVDKLFGRY